MTILKFLMKMLFEIIEDIEGLPSPDQLLEERKELLILDDVVANKTVMDDFTGEVDAIIVKWTILTKIFFH